MGRLSKAEVKPTEEASDLIVAYKAMVDLMRQGQAGAKIDNTRYLRLEAKCNALFLKLDGAQQRVVVDRLVESGHMDPRVAEILAGIPGSTVGKV